MVVQPSQQATIEDLYRVPEEGKAELVGGKIVLLPLMGEAPGYAGDSTFVSLRGYARDRQYGRAVGDNKGFNVNLPNRKSCSLDAAFHIGAPTGMKFYNGAPNFAVEVRSENDYGPAEERRMAAKRTDYFAAGTLVVWDVDSLSEDVVKKYTAANPATLTIFKCGQLADAEPAVPGWTMPVDDLFG